MKVNKKRTIFFWASLFLTLTHANLFPMLDLDQEEQEVISQMFKIVQKKINKSKRRYKKNKIQNCKLEQLKQKRKKIIKEKWQEVIKLRKDGQNNEAAKISYQVLAYQDYFPHIRYNSCLFLAYHLQHSEKKQAIQIVKECLHTLLNFADQTILSPSIKATAHMTKGSIYNKKSQKKHSLKKIIEYKRKFIKHMTIARNHFIQSIEKEKEINLQKNQMELLFCTLELAKFFSFYIKENYKTIDIKKIKYIKYIKYKAISYFNQITSYESKNMSPYTILYKINALIFLGKLYIHPICNQQKEALILFKKVITLTKKYKETLDQTFGKEQTTNFIEVAKEKIEEIETYKQNF